MGDAAGEFDDFLAAGDFAEGVGDDLAVLGGDDLGQLALAVVEQLTELEQHLGALGQRGVAPGRERRGGGVDHGAGVLDAGQRDLTGDRTGRRVRHRRGGTAAAGERGVVEPMGNRILHGSSMPWESGRRQQQSVNRDQRCVYTM